MLTTVEAEIDVNGNVTLLEPIKLTKKSRAIVTVLENGDSSNTCKQSGKKLSDLFGSASLGHPTGLDNEQIDADLARECVSKFE
ncbi:MAG: hypothetical protein AB7P14_16330 [Blastocatellales bacterium]